MFQRAGRFSKNHRLGRPVEYQQVFRSSCRSKDNYMLVIAAENNMGIARLGLAISKKNVKTAIKRNQIKRIIRESFRLNQQNLEGLDIVVTAHRASVEAEKGVLKDSISKHWQHIIECKKY